MIASRPFRPLPTLTGRKLRVNPANTRDDIQEWSLLSYLARVNYSFKGKYHLSVSVASRWFVQIRRGQQVGYVPFCICGWNVTDEAFMSNVQTISALKVRASYGTVGNNNIGNYTQYATVSTTTNAIFGSTLAPGASLTTLANTSLGWETTKAVDVGLELGLFDSGSILFMTSIQKIQLTSFTT